jgi:hypothetical protein
MSCITLGSLVTEEFLAFSAEKTAGARECLVRNFAIG